MFWCGDCRLWQHENCLAKAIKENLAKSGNPFKPQKTHMRILADENTAIKAYIMPGTKAQASEPRSKINKDLAQMVIPVKCLRCNSQLK
jgi:hypothetical protein